MFHYTMKPFEVQEIRDLKALSCKVEGKIFCRRASRKMIQNLVALSPLQELITSMVHFLVFDLHRILYVNMRINATENRWYQIRKN